jgi:hypothetical protein
MRHLRNVGEEPIELVVVEVPLRAAEAAGC